MTSRVPASGSIERQRRVMTTCALLLLLFVLSVGVAVGSDRAGGVPAAQIAVSESGLPDVAMKAGVLVTSDGRELWARRPDEQRALASTTKIMTAVVALERTSIDDVVPVSSRAVAIGESVAGLRAGDTLTVRQILEAMLVKSGNEAAEALAEHVAGSAGRFVEMMNAKADELGLADTRFANPHGLDAPNHHTSARDLSVLARYAMADDEFRRVAGLAQVDFDGPGGVPPLENSNLLIGSYEGATGVKTGWTSKAGYCLVASAERDGIELTAVVLGTSNERTRFDQARTLLDWGFDHYGLRTIVSGGEEFGTVPVSDYLDIAVIATVESETRVAVFDLDGEVVREVSLYPEVKAPVARGDRIGTLTVRQDERLLGRVALVSSEDVEAPGLFERAWIAVVRAWRSAFGVRPAAGTAGA